MTPFGTTQDGKDIHKITLSDGDLTVCLLTWGAIVQDVRLAGVAHSLTLRSDDLADYEGDMRYYGALIGPIANRISAARIRLDGMMYELERNQDGRIHLHSGAQATHRQVWDVVTTSATSATLRLHLPDGMCGLPGNRKIVAKFTVSAPASLTMEITGTTDAKTCMNFANHSYWNLDGTPTYDGHQLMIEADHYLPVDLDVCPTGEIATVGNTEMDFRATSTLSAGTPPLDTNFCLSDERKPLRKVMTLTGQSGVHMALSTTEPGLQVYDGRDAELSGRKNYAGLAIEAQGWPDAPAHSSFPSIIVSPEKPYQQTTKWQFATNKTV